MVGTVPLQQAIKDNQSFQSVPLGQNITDNPSLRQVVNSPVSNLGIANSQFSSSDDVRAHMNNQDRRRSDSIIRQQSINPIARHVGQNRNYFRPADGQRDHTQSRLSNPLIPLPDNRVVSNKRVCAHNRVASNNEVWAHQEDEIENVIDRPIPHFSDMPSQRRQDEVTRNYFSEDDS